MLNNCTIWIGLPAFNEEKAIKKVLKSIISLKKKINKIRVIIVNDGSKDKTLLNAKKFQKKLNIKIINNKKNKGVSISRNKGIEYAKGEYLFFVDSDDKLIDNSLLVNC